MSTALKEVKKIMIGNWFPTPAVCDAHAPVILMFYLLFPPTPSTTVSYQNHQKDATYITVSSQPTPKSEPSARIVKSMSLRAAIAKGQIVRLGDANKPAEPVKPGAFEVNKFFRRLSFKHQVRSMSSVSSRLASSDVN